MIKIDFHAGTHGHFLEFISNIYIMQTATGCGELFDDVGASHDVDKEYLKARLIRCDHYSKHKQDFDPTDTIIRITLDTTDDMWFYIAFVNLMFRAFGGFDQQLLLIDSDVRNSNARLRNDFYSKFNEREIYVKEYPKFTKVSDTIPIFEFPFECFYSIDRFCTKLSELSTFLNCTFFINEDFYSHWKKFIDLNQGWQSYVKCRDILEKIFSNKDSKINCSIIEQAWINYNLTKICKIFSGPMFDEDSYPENCRDIYAEIQKQLSKRR